MFSRASVRLAAVRRPVRAKKAKLAASKSHPDVSGGGSAFPTPSPRNSTLPGAAPYLDGFFSEKPAQSSSEHVYRHDVFDEAQSLTLGTEPMPSHWQSAKPAAWGGRQQSPQPAPALSTRRVSGSKVDLFAPGGGLVPAVFAEEIETSEAPPINVTGAVSVGRGLAPAVRSAPVPTRRRDGLRTSPNVAVEGVEVPPPVASFGTAGLDPAIRQQLAALGISVPTPIQAYALPSAAAGRDFVGISPTGSGKTLAFGIPLLQGLLQLPNNVHRANGQLPDVSAPPVVVLSPSRELARQTADMLRTLGAPLGLRVACVSGGGPLTPQLDELARRPHVVVGTPGRLLDISDSRRDALRLSSVRMLVLDEVDTLLEVGSETAVRALGALLPFKPQVMMFTATWPAGVQALAADFLGAYVKVALDVGRAVPTIDYKFTLCRPPEKLRLLHRDLTDIAEDAHPASMPRTLVFLNERADVDFAARYLFSKGLEVGRVHGELPQAQRDAAVRAFRSGDVPVLLATNVASRGLDVPGVRYVFNVDFPDGVESFLHRCGRTGRNGESGTAVSYITLEDGAAAPGIINALETAGTPASGTLVEVAAAFRERRAFSSGAAHQRANMSRKPKYRAVDVSDTDLLYGDDETVVRELSRRAAPRGATPARGAAVDTAAAAASDEKADFLRHLRQKYIAGEAAANTFRRAE